jgi:RNA polymerase sigma-70 factor (ECF subfamily)
MLDDRFLALLEEHRKILYKVANAYCRDAEDRRDLVQEIVVQLWRSFPRFDARARFSTWTYRIAMNVAISFYRSESRWSRRRELVDETALEILAVDRVSPEDSSDEVRQLHRRIAELDAMNRALVILYLDGNSHEAIGEILGISTTSVGTRIGRIKERFRRDLERAKPARTGGRHGTG